MPLSLVLLNQRGQVLTAEEEVSGAEDSEVVDTWAVAVGLDQLEVVAATVAVAFVVALLVVSTRQVRYLVVRAEAELVTAYRATLHLGHVRHISRASIPDELADQ